MLNKFVSFILSLISFIGGAYTLIMFFCKYNINYGLLCLMFVLLSRVEMLHCNNYK
jgi:hypothetical protein